jgi:hypothetical protein
MLSRGPALALSLSVVPGFALLAGCPGTPCRNPSDCDLGNYCAVEASASGASGTCRHDCLVAKDCPDDPSGQNVAVCTNLGRCGFISQRVALFVDTPDDDVELPMNTQLIRVLGEVELAAESAFVTATPSGRPNCLSGQTQGLSVTNPNPGHFTRVPFALDNVEIYPGPSTVLVVASAGSAHDSVMQTVTVPCTDCARIAILDPKDAVTSVGGLVLPVLSGGIDPVTVSIAEWRVRSQSGDVFSGTIHVQGGLFTVNDLPLFPGLNRVEVDVSGVGSGSSRCAAGVTAGFAEEHGLRGVLIWDGSTGDVDLHLIGPGGRFGDPATDLFSGSMMALGGSLKDVFMGYGPEVGQIPTLKDGVYGVVVEPVLDDQDPGENAMVWLLVDGRPLVRGALGPMYISSQVGLLWMVGTVSVVGGAATWHALGDLIPVSMPPTRPPSDWPMYN